MRERVAAARAWLGPRLRRLPRPTPLQLLKLSPVIVAGVVLLVLLARNHDTVDFPEYEVPEGFVLAPPPTTAGPGAQLPPLVANVPGTTAVAVPPNVGTAALEGSVLGPGGAIPGAVVRIERRILGEVQTADVVADAAGRWRAEGIGGGRYRVRAFLPPTLASRTAEVFLLPAGERRALDLTVEAFTEASLSLASAPAPATVGAPVNIGVLLVRRAVDGDGFVGTAPIAGAAVELSVPGDWVRTGTGAIVTGGDGQATATFTCRRAGTVSVVATVRLGSATPTTAPSDTTAPGAPTPPAPAPLTAQATFECVDPVASTTTTVPGASTTTVPGGTTTTTIPDVGD